VSVSLGTPVGKEEEKFQAISRGDRKKNAIKKAGLRRTRIKTRETGNKKKCASSERFSGQSATEEEKRGEIAVRLKKVYAVTKKTSSQHCGKKKSRWCDPPKGRERTEGRPW